MLVTRPGEEENQPVCFEPSVTQSLINGGYPPQTFLPPLPSPARGAERLRKFSLFFITPVSNISRTLEIRPREGRVLLQGEKPLSILRSRTVDAGTAAKRSVRRSYRKPGYPYVKNLINRSLPYCSFYHHLSAGLKDVALHLCKHSANSDPAGQPRGHPQSRADSRAGTHTSRRVHSMDC